MRTWKNRRHPKKHKKTVSRKQRGGGFIATQRVRDWLNGNPKFNAAYREQVEAAEATNAESIIIDNDVIRQITAWETKVKPTKASPFGQVPQQGTPASQLFANSLRGTNISPENAVPSIVKYTTPRTGTNPLFKPASLSSEDVDPGIGEAAVPTPDPFSPAVTANYVAPRTTTNPFVGSPKLRLPEQPEPLAPIAPTITPESAEARLATALNSGVNNPMLKGRTPSAATGSLVYPMSSSSKESRSVRDCDAELAELRKELEAIKSGVLKTKAETDASTKALQERIAQLEAEIAAKEKDAAALRAALAALQDEKGDLASRLAGALKELQTMTGANKDLAGEVSSLSDAVNMGEAAEKALQEQIVHLKGLLEQAAKEAEAAASASATTISELRAAHVAELAALRQKHGEEMAALQAKFDAAVKSAESAAGASAAEKKKLEETIAALRAEIAGQREVIEEISGELSATKQSLTEALAAAAQAAAQAQAAAAAAAQAAQEAAARLAALQAENASLSQQLAAALAAAAAAQAAEETAEAAKQRAEEEAAAAAAAAQAAAQAQAAAAAAAQADSRRSQAEQDAASQAAEAAEAAAAAARAAAEEANRRAAAAEAARAAAAAAAAAAQAALNKLKSSTPKIVKIEGEDGSKVGGGDGRQVLMGETLIVTWEKGGETPLAWVFVMFSGGTPAYTQLVIGEERFKFESTVGGDISAVMFDVVVHSKAELGF